MADNDSAVQIQILVSGSGSNRGVTVTAMTAPSRQQGRRLPPLPSGGAANQVEGALPGNQIVSARFPRSPGPFPGPSITRLETPSTTRQPNRQAIRSPRNKNSLLPVNSMLVNGQNRETITMNGGIKYTTNYQDFVISDLTEESVYAYLKANPTFLEDYIMNDVELEQLERWMIRKTQRTKEVINGKIARKTSLSRWKFCVHADKRKMLQELTQTLQVRPNKAYVLWELGSCIASAVNADGYNLYVVNKDTQDIHYFNKETDNFEENGIFAHKISASSCIAAYVARSRQTLRSSTPNSDPRFPDGVAVNGDIARAVLCQPITQGDGQLLGVLELYRKEGGPEFYEEDEEIVHSYLVWGSIALHYAEMYYNMLKQRKLNDFLLNVVKSIFQDMVSMDTVIMKVMKFAQKLVNADRASLFLVDNKTKELYARVFDVGSEKGNGDEPTSKPKEIRFPIGTGIAGRVAENGEVLNIANAYDDPRFNRAVDILTGYTTRTILCMPIFIRGIVIGVVQMVNKLSGQFNKSDEESFEVFASYCGLALHHAKLYDKIRKSEQKYKVAMEVLSYHYTCDEEEVNNIKNQPIMEKITPDLDEFYFATMSLTVDEKTAQSIFMFTDLFGTTRCDLDCLVRFTLTVKKNYRRVPYHNWNHGFTVANSGYVVLKKAKDLFNPIESLALYIGCMCHDLDHRGKTNKFMLDTASPLAAMYSTSTLEHHHFNQTVSILQQSGHNIFKSLTSEEYKAVLGDIRHFILATDLATFFPNKTKLNALLDLNAFDWNNAEHRAIVKAIVMTGCDLCASTKPWESQSQTVKGIFEEFYDQGIENCLRSSYLPKSNGGARKCFPKMPEVITSTSSPASFGDLERAAGRIPIPMMDRTKPDQQAISQGDADKVAGRIPIPMMDRNKADEMPACQVGFIQHICVPCYELMYRIIPETLPMLEGCRKNLMKWQELADEIKRKKDEEEAIRKNEEDEEEEAVRKKEEEEGEAVVEEIES